MPGALKRILAFVANLKTRPGYTTDIGTNLQIISTTVPIDPGDLPDPEAVAESGQAALSFGKIVYASSPADDAEQESIAVARISVTLRA